MNITFLGQGLEPESLKSVGNNLIRLFKENKFNSFTVISAFASESGVLNLAENIAESPSDFDTVKIIVGVDQEGTPVKALEKILELNVTSYIFYQRESPIFHPKIYLFEGEKEYTLIVGSSNLTGRGLFANVESSIMIEGDYDNDAEPLNQFKEYYAALLNLTDRNLFKITTENIRKFVAEGIVPTKNVWKKKHGKKTSEIEPKKESELNIPKRNTAKIPNFYKGLYKTNNTVSEIIYELEIGNDFEFDNSGLNEILWESGELTERDLNIPKGENTNPTGSMLLKKGKSKTINTRHYFRDEVFNSLDWTFDNGTKTTHIERANADFRIIILGVDYGVFSLKISHNTNSQHLESVKQPASQIHWGESKKLIAHDELIGKTAYLYRTANQTNEFTLVM